MIREVCNKAHKYRLGRPQGCSASGRIKSRNGLKHLIGNRACDLSACSAVSQPIALPRTPPLHTPHHQYCVVDYYCHVERTAVQNHLWYLNVTVLLMS
jgi:hypothetical protein